MAPLATSLVGYRVSDGAIKQYRLAHDLPPVNDRPLLQHLEATMGVPLALIRVEQDDDAATAEYYLCCFADYHRAYDAEALLAIPIPHAFRRLPQIIPVEGDDVRRLFAPKAMVFSFDETGKSRVNDRGLPISAESV